MKKYLCMMALALMIGAGARAQENVERKNAQKEPPTVEQMAKREADRMRRQLLLGDDQYDKVYKICLKRAEAQRKRMEQMRKERKEESEQMKGILNDAQYERYEQLQRQPAFGRQGMRQGMRPGFCPNGCKCVCPAAKDDGLAPAPQRQAGPTIDRKGDPRRNMTIRRGEADGAAGVAVEKE